ncbi:uncharacterized protein LOC144348399 [Saccoglossus kowalevskii]
MVDGTLDELRELYSKLENELDDDEFDKIKNLLIDKQLTKRDRQQINRPTALFLKLEDKGYISRNNLSLLKKLLRDIERSPLIKKYVDPTEMALAKKTKSTEVKPPIEEKKLGERLSNMEDDGDVRVQKKEQDEVDAGTTVRYRHGDRGDFKEQPQHSKSNPKPKKPQKNIGFQSCCIIFVAFAFVILGLGYYLHVNETFTSVATDTKKTPQQSINKQESDEVDLNKENVQKNDSSKPCEKLKSHDER